MRRVMPRLALAAAALLLAQPASAAVEEYVFDKGHTNIHFQWNHFGFSTTSAEFEDFSGTLLLDEEHLSQSRVSVTIDLASVDSGFAEFNGDLRGEDWFHVEQYPEATFESTDIKSLGKNQYEVTGQLSLHGVTREVVLDTTINKIGMHPITEARTIGFDATTTVKRSDFGLGQYAPAVSDEITILISSEMSRKSDLTKAD